MRVIKYTLFLFLVLSSFLEIQATHVAGGSMTYRCLGNSRYEISLEFRRDCFNGSDDAQFDDFAIVTIFNSSNQIVNTLGSGGKILIPFMQDDTLNEKLTSICNVIGDDVCVQTTVYMDTLILPQRAGGYILAYQRCCRNSALSNVEDPLNTGSTYWVRITETALQLCNSSPVFKNLPGVFICVNDTLRFDHKASDIDGDSLVYYLCTPSAGGSVDVPRPDPASKPPFDRVVWGAGFSENNMMGGSPISINSESGQLIAVPNQVGQFLIGVCVREFRDGVLLSEIRRDYEYAVRICGRDPIAGFDPDQFIKCDGLEVEFENFTTSNFLPLDSIDFEWIFDYPEGTLTSNEVAPVVVYPEGGQYDVRMVATDGICFDTVFTTVGVSQTGDPTADFAFDSYDCDGETVVQFYQTSITSQANPEHFWIVRFGGSVVILNGESPSLNIGSDQNLIVNYEIKTESGCIDVVSRDIDIQTIPLRVEFEDKIICRGEDVYIFQSDIPDLEVVITPDIGIINDGAGGYYVNGFTGNIEFEITVTDGFCLDQGIVSISSEAEPNFPLEDVIQCGDDAIGLNNSGPRFYYYEWVGPEIKDPHAVNPQVSLLSDGDYFVTVYTSEGSLCSFSDSLSVKVSEIPSFEIINEATMIFCEGDSIDLFVSESFPTIIWTDDKGNNLGNSDHITIDRLMETTTYTAQVFTEDGCTTTRSMEIIYSRLPVINVSGNTSTMVCMGDDATLLVVSLDSITWVDEDGNLLATGFEYTIPEVTEPTDITVVATNELGCQEELTFNIGLHPDPMPDLSPIEDINICPGMITSVILDIEEDIKWYNADGDLVATGPEWMIEGIIEDETYSVVVTNSFGCQDSVDFTVHVDEGIVPEVDLMILDSVMLCVDTDFSVNIISSDTVRWLDLDDNVIAQGNSFMIENVTDTLVFQISVIDSFNCELRDTFAINPFEGIELDISSSSQIEFYCEGESIDLSTVTNVNANIEWYIDDQLVNTGDSLISYFPDGDINIVAIAMDQFGCMSRDSFMLRESATAGEVSGDSLICIFGNAELNYTPEVPGDVFSIMWSPQEGIVEDNGLSITVSPDSTITYQVVYSNEDECITIDSFNVFVSGYINGIMAFADPQEILLGESLDLSTDQFPEDEYQWSPPETLDDEFSDMPIAMPTESITYVVTVTDEFGCTATDEVTVDVIQPNCDESDIYIPNTFTPNGDNLNDVFRIESNFIDQQNLIIYNRWGEEVFSSTDTNAVWDGTYNGTELHTDVFGYFVEIVCINGFEYSSQGNITLSK